MRFVAWVTGVTLAKESASFVVAAWHPQLWPKQNSPPAPRMLWVGVCGPLYVRLRLAAAVTSCAVVTVPPFRPRSTQLDMGRPPGSV